MTGFFNVKNLLHHVDSGRDGWIDAILVFERTHGVEFEIV